MLSQTNEYALRILVHLAGCDAPMQTTPQIAAVTKIPVGYLAKVLQTLTRSGLISAQRGLHGGFALVRQPDDVSLFDVVDAVDPLRRIHSCPLQIKSHARNLCALHRRMDEIFEEVERAFRETTLADLLAEPNPSRPFCETGATASRAGGRGVELVTLTRRGKRPRQT